MIRWSEVGLQFQRKGNVLYAEARTEWSFLWMFVFSRQTLYNGLAVIVISHNLNDVFQVADNIAAMYLGTMAAQVEKNSVSQNDVVRLITTGSADAVSGAKK